MSDRFPTGEPSEPTEDQLRHAAEILWVGTVVGTEARVAQALADAEARGYARGAAEAAHEWQCPACGATTRARMADR